MNRLSQLRANQVIGHTMKYDSIGDWFELVSSVLSAETIKLGLRGPDPANLKSANALAWELLKRRVEPMTVEDADAIWFTGNCLKKFRFADVDQFARASTSIEAFLVRNEEVGQRSLHWFLRRRMRELLARVMPYPSTCDEPRFGTGSVFEGIPVDKRWSRLSKYPQLRDAPLVRGTTLSLLSAERDVARLCAVPKDAWVDRIITVEPWLSSYCQQAARFMLEASIHCGPLRGSVMDALAWRDPVIQQQEYARRASLSMSLVTLDLKDASDNISWALVQDVFPPWVCAAVEPWRSTHVVYAGRRYPVRLYAGMGNATTFRIETMYFWALVTAVLDYFHINGRVSVFGDDIVCPSALLQNHYALSIAKDAGLVVNTLKSGEPGWCAEACGAMFYRGARLPTLNRVYGTRDIVMLVDLAQRLLDSSSRAQQDLGWWIWYTGDFTSVQTDLRPTRACDVLCHQSVLSRGDRGHIVSGPNFNVGCMANVAVLERRFRYRNHLSPGEALGVLRRQLSADTVEKGRRRGQIAVRLPERSDAVRYTETPRFVQCEPLATQC